MKRIIVMFLCLACLFPGCSVQESTPTELQENIPTWERDTVTTIAPYLEKLLETINCYLEFDYTESDVLNDLLFVLDRITLSDFDTLSIDQKAYQSILSFFYDYKNMSDVQYMMYRDVLNFYLGREVSGTVFAKPQLTLNGFTKETYDILGLWQYPMIKFNLSVNNNHPSADEESKPLELSMYFDKLTVDTPSNIVSYCIEAYTNAKHTGVNVVEISGLYTVYDQGAFWFSIQEADTENVFTISISEYIGEELYSGTDAEAAKEAIEQYMSECP